MIAKLNNTILLGENEIEIEDHTLPVLDFEVYLRYA